MARAGQQRRRQFSAKEGIMSANRLAWCKTAIGQFVIMLQPEREDVSVRLFHPRPGGRPVTFNFTALTEPELDAMESLFKVMFDLARPVVIRRDKVAADALENGDDSYARVYRQLPQLVIREGKKSTDNQGIWLGPEGTDEVACDHPREPDKPCAWCMYVGERELRGYSDDVAPEPEGDSSPEDDGSETFEPEELC